MAEREVTKVTCTLCDQDFTGMTRETMLLHVMLYHPVEMISTPSVQHLITSNAFRFGQWLADQLKGATNAKP